MFKFNNEIPEVVVEVVKTCWNLFGDGNDNTYAVGSKMESECEVEINNDKDREVLYWFKDYEGMLFSFRDVDIRVELTEIDDNEEYFYLKMTWIEPDWMKMKE